MHIVLVGPEFEENLSLRYLAAALQQAGHTAHLARFDSAEYIEGVVQQVQNEQPGIVGLSMVFQVRAREFYALARALRQAGYGGHITAGGHFATFAYEPMLRDLPELDSIIRQEGEATLTELADALEQDADPAEIARIPGLATRDAQGDPTLAPPRRQVADLDTLPFPTRDVQPERHLGVPTAYLVGSRGCYADCDYCSIFAWHEAALGKRYRMRTVGNIAEEMAFLYHERGVRFFVFHDDNFFLPKAEGNRKRFEALKAEIERHGLRDIGLMLKLRPNDCDPQNMRLLKEMGLLRAFVGIENASQQQLRTLGRDSTVEDVEACLAMLRELDIYATYNILLFDPYTTLEDVACNLRFLRRNRHFPFNWCKVEAYAGTALETRYRMEGRLRGDYLGHGYVMEDARTRLLYDLLLPAFHYRNYDYYGLANLNIGLGYHRQLLKHFYPQQAAPTLCRRIQKLTGRINSNTLDLLEEALDFARAVPLTDTVAIQAFTEELKRKAFRGQHALSEEVELLHRTIERAAGVSQEAHAGVSEAFTPLSVDVSETSPSYEEKAEREGNAPLFLRRKGTGEEVKSSRTLNRRDALSVLSGGLAALAAGCSKDDTPTPPKTGNGTPVGTIRVAEGHPSSVAKGQTMFLEAAVLPEGTQVAGPPRITTSGGKIKSVQATPDNRVVRIEYLPDGGYREMDPNLTLTISWTVRNGDTDTVIMARAFVHIKEDDGYAFGYVTPRPTIAEMAAPPINQSGPSP